jgi:AraC-like DNA-binding protein
MIDEGRGENGPAGPRLIAGLHTMVLQDPSGSAGPERAFPVWTILLSLAGHIEWRTGRSPGRAPGVIFPPQLFHHASCATGHLTVFIDPWYQGLGPGQGSAVPLDSGTVEYLAGRWSTVDTADLGERARETVTYLRHRLLLPPPVAIDPRVSAAVQGMHVADGVAGAAADVGLSPSRFRALVHDLTGTSPARVRTWRRLRTAVLDLADKPIALAAADAGFSDQAHMTRTASRLLGHTPGDLVRMVQGSRAGRRRDDVPATAAAFSTYRALRRQSGSSGTDGPGSRPSSTARVTAFDPNRSRRRSRAASSTAAS